MNTSSGGLSLIKEFEGLRLTAYPDSADVWTIGYGHTRTARQGMTITEAEAERLLAEDVKWAEDAVNRQVSVPLTQSQFDALVSFVFNVGAGAFAGSTLLRKLNAGEYGAVPAQLARWDKATVNGQKTQLAGLARRRAAEGRLWAQDGEDVVAKPAPIRDRKPSQSKTVQGAAVGAVGALGAAGAIISEAAMQLQPLTEYSDIVKLAFLALTLGGIGLTVWGRVRVMRAEGV